MDSPMGVEFSGGGYYIVSSSGFGKPSQGSPVDMGKMSFDASPGAWIIKNKDDEEVGGMEVSKDGKITFSPPSGGLVSEPFKAVITFGSKSS
ncbi:hypothetical protein E4U21_005484 [Claviceps maximensis]|nr:hypothetical protein E4U21_005484 [Claviceps maximensis]